jgi:pyruvate dehydrogenase E1 component alpha subunit
MLLIRRFEEKAGQLYGMGLIGGFCHLYIGQEAVVVGMQMAIQGGAIRSSPAIATTATCWPAAWTQGRHGRADRPRGGSSKGKGGSMHMFSREKNFYGGHGIVGAQVSLGTGLALRQPYREDGLVASPISATARPTRARSMRASTWPSSGSCR